MTEDEAKDKKTGQKVKPPRAAQPCPECGKPAVRESYPFCSARCRSLDLNRWLSGRYYIPGPKPDEEED